MDRRVIFVLQEFPPPVSGGNMRVYKYAKYLTRSGWQVTIVCKGGRKAEAIRADAKVSAALEGVRVIGVADLKERLSGLMRRKARPSPAVGAMSATSRVTVPAKRDANAKSAVHGGSPLKRLARGVQKLVVPDSGRVIWVPFASRAVFRLVREEGIPYLVTSSPPHSSQLVGLAAKRRFGERIRWIADFRDLWNLSPSYALGMTKRREANRRTERSIVRHADLTVHVSASMRDEVFRSLGLSGTQYAARGAVVTNGYDEEDFNPLGDTRWTGLSGPSPEIRYVGTVAGPRTANALALGFRKHLAARPGSSLALRFIGDFDAAFRDAFGDLPFVSFSPQVPHWAALREMAGADALLLILTNDLEGRIAFTGKFFEYLRVRRPILALVPEGEVSSAVRASGLGEVACPDDPDDIAAALGRLEEGLSTGRISIPASDAHYLAFERSSLSAAFDSLLSGLEPPRQPARTVRGARA